MLISALFIDVGTVIALINFLGNGTCTFNMFGFEDSCLTLGLRSRRSNI